MAFAILTLASARASAQKVPFLFLSPGSHTAPPWLQWAAGADAWSGDRTAVRPATFAYKLVAFVAKEVLDDASYEYRESPVGSFLNRQTPAEHSRSEIPAISSSVANQDPPPTLEYPVRSRIAMRDLWSALNQGREDDGSSFSVDPKVGAGRAGFILTFRW